MQRDQKGQTEINSKGVHGGRRSAPSSQAKGTQRQLRLCSSFAVVVGLVYLAVLVLLVAFVVVVDPFVFAAFVVCAAGAVLHVVVVALAIKQNSKGSK